MIEVSNLTKKYGSYVAVDNISFTVNDGEILGFLGPNGAGKTTTMNMMTGFISSSEGSIKINGYDILDEPMKAKSQLGYLPDVPPLYGDMTVTEYLNFVCDIKKIKKSERPLMIEQIMRIVRISDVSHRIVKNLSKGYRQRVGLAQALVGFPEVLILDEPTVGLDPKQIIEMREVIKDLGERHTVILSSHILSEVSAVCDRVMIINKGKIVAGDTTESLTDINNVNRQSVRVAGDRDEIISKLESGEGIESAKITGSFEPGTFDVEVKGQDDTDVRIAISNILSKWNMPILMMKPAAMSLEEIFLEVINGDYEIKELKKAEEEIMKENDEVTENNEDVENENKEGE